MRCLIVSAVFPPEPVVSAKTSLNLAEELMKRGHEVTVITTFPSRPGGMLHIGFSRRLVRRSHMENGLRIIRCFSFLSRRSTFYSRFLENISFGIMSCFTVFVCCRTDVIYGNSWPIFSTFLLLLAARLRRIPFVYSVQDVYPESLIAQGRMTDKNVLFRFLRYIDSAISRRSDHVIVISKAFAEIFRKQRAIKKIQLSVVPNWADTIEIDVSIPRNQFRKRVGIPDGEFVMVYGGNVGMAAGVELVINAMEMLPRETKARLVIAGEGSQLRTCRKLAHRLPAGRVLFLSPWNRDQTSEVLRAADLLLLPTRGSQSLFSAPSKLVYYMFAARPIIALALRNSAIAKTIEDAGCGWVTEPDQLERLENQIRVLYSMPRAELEYRGQLGRQYALKNFTKEVCLPKVIEILETVGRRKNTFGNST